MLSLILLASLAGSFGALIRAGVASNLNGRFPLGTFVINITGSFGIGLLSALYIGAVISEQWYFILGAGLLGGMTTFSTWALEGLSLFEDKERMRSISYLLGTLVLAYIAALVGHMIMRGLVSS